MAIQNFISGGYYGKLGVTVGQRWKNKRTVRAYVVPNNPRTPAMEANRQAFGSCVSWAQIGQSMNFKAPCWASAELIEWNLRMSRTRTLQKAGKTDMELIPIYPENYSPAFVISKLEIIDSGTSSMAICSASGTLPTDERLISIYIEFPDGQGNVERALCRATLNTLTQGEVLIELPAGKTIDDTCRFLLVSADDSAYNNQMVASAVLTFTASQIVTMPFDTTVSEVIASNTALIFVLAQDYQEGDNSVSGVSAYGVSNGAFTTWQLDSATLININGKFAISARPLSTYNEDLIAFPAGGFLNIDAIRSAGASFIYEAKGVQQSVLETNPTRSIEKEAVYNSVQNNSWYWTFADGAVLPTVSERRTISTLSYGNLAPLAKDVDYLFENQGNMLTFARENAHVYAGAEAVKTPSAKFALKSAVSIAVSGVTYTLQATDNMSLGIGGVISPEGTLSVSGNNTILTIAGNTTELPILLPTLDSPLNLFVYGRATGDIEQERDVYMSGLEISGNNIVITFPTNINLDNDGNVWVEFYSASVSANDVIVTIDGVALASLFDIA